jgi:hypothetical protein
VGPRGLTVLSIAGIAGLFFGVLGWTQRGTGLVTPQVTAPSASATTASPPATSSPSATGPASAAAGPQLSSMPYASYAYQVWPGPVSATAKLALSGWNLTITREPGGITVKATLDGQPMPSVSHFYPGGAKVYALDSNLGDDGSGDTDYDDTDDGLAVTNAQGQVLG